LFFVFSEQLQRLSPRVFRAKNVEEKSKGALPRLNFPDRQGLKTLEDSLEDILAPKKKKKKKKNKNTTTGDSFFFLELLYKYVIIKIV
jgi:hypothetical protein